MRILNLNYVGMTHVDEVRTVDLVKSYQTYAIGDGLWSIEAKTSNDTSIWGPSCKTWTGLNGTRLGEEAEDLWENVHEWESDPAGGQAIIREAYDYRTYEAPDGARGSYSFFEREAMNGHLHGCIVQFN